MDSGKSAYVCAAALTLWAGGLLLPPAWPQEAPPSKLTAREVFYGQEPPAATSATTPPTQPLPKRTTPVKRTNKTATSTPAVSDSTTQTPPTSVTLAKLSTDPLGLRVTLLKQGNAGWEEVDRDAIFRPGDHTQINVEANDRGYLYIIARQSSGIWKPLFPRARNPQCRQ